jgi:hypothetical protein
MPHRLSLSEDFSRNEVIDPPSKELVDVVARVEVLQARILEVGCGIACCFAI